MNPGPFDVFVSYSRRDNEPAAASRIDALRRFVESAPQQAGSAPLRLFFDTDDIRDFDDWRHRILGGLRQSKLLLVCLSPNYLNSPNCRWEWEHFLLRQGQRDLDQAAAIACVQLADIPAGISSANSDWYTSIRRANNIDLKRWFASQAALEHDAETLQQAERLRAAVQDRVRLARRSLAARRGNMPEATEHFVGRGQQLRKIHEELGAGRIGMITALHGLGGIGKTELALHYAHDYAHSYPGGLWFLPAAQAKDLQQLIGRLADHPRFPRKPADSDRRSDAALCDFVLQVIEETAAAHELLDPSGGRQILLLLDNVDFPDELLGAAQRKRLPRTDWLCVLATTRVQPVSWQRSERLTPIAVDALDSADALALLREWQPGHAFRSDDEASAAQELVAVLGGYTLAVEQAATYLGLHPSVSLRALLEKLRSAGSRQLDQLVATDTGLRNEIAHADRRLDLILEQTLPRPGSLARAVLDYAAQWAPDSIPRAWVEDWAQQQHAGLCASPELESPLQTAWQQLESQRLLVPRDGNDLLRLHRLIREHLLAECGPELAAARDAQIDRQTDALLDDAQRLSIAQWRLTALLDWVRMFLPEPNPLVVETANILVETILPHRGPGSLAELAMQTLAAAEQVAAKLGSANGQRALSISLCSVSDIMNQQGEAAAALQACTRSLQIREQLVAQDPHSAQAQRDVSISLNKVGGIQQQQGDAAAALQAYTRSLQISERLAAQDPHSARAQRDVSVSLDKVGGIQEQQGDAAAALQVYTRSLQIRERLAAQDPHSAQAQRDVSISLNKVGGIQQQQGDAAAALQAYTRSLQISERLAAQDPHSAEAQRDVSISLDKVGGIQEQQGDAAAALQVYTRSLQIRERLAAQDPHSAQAQRDVSISLNKVGWIQEQQGDAAAALQAYTRSLQISERLAAQDPHSAQAQRDVSVSLDNIGGIQEQQGDAAAALQAYTRSLQISERLATQDPDSALAQRDLWVSHFKLFRLAEYRQDNVAVRHHLQAAHAIFAAMDARGMHISPSDRSAWDTIKSLLD